mgnify:CR=1 FL=1
MGNWAKIYEKGQEVSGPSVTTTYVSEAKKNKKLSSQDLAEEIKALAFAILKTNKVDYVGLQSLLAIPNLQTSVYDFAMKSALAEGFPDSKRLRSLIGKMLSLDPQNLPNLEELKVKEESNQHLSKLVAEESKQLPGETQSGSPNKPSTIIGIILPTFIFF